MATILELTQMSENLNDVGTPTIFGQSHALLAELAEKAARAAAEDHVRAGRLAPAHAVTIQPSSGSTSAGKP